MKECMNVAAIIRLRMDAERITLKRHIRSFTNKNYYKEESWIINLNVVEYVVTQREVKNQ